MNERLKHYSDKLAYETDSWDLKVALEAGENIVVIDARSSQAFAQAHIPGAINIPHRDMNPETTRYLRIGNSKSILALAPRERDPRKRPWGLPASPAGGRPSLAVLAASPAPGGGPAEVARSKTQHGNARPGHVAQDALR